MKLVLKELSGTRTKINIPGECPPNLDLEGRIVKGHIVFIHHLL